MNSSQRKLAYPRGGAKWGSDDSVGGRGTLTGAARLSFKFLKVLLIF